MRLQEVFLSLSQDFTQDETLLSLRERELLTSIWRHTRQFANGNSADTERVEKILTYALGETILQRVSAEVGGHVLEAIKQQAVHCGFPARDRLREFSPPPSPHTGPHPPSPSPSPGPGSKSADRSLSLGTPTPPAPAPRPPGQAPLGPHPPSPGPGPGSVESAQPAHSSVSIAEHPDILRAQYVALDEFLAPEELQNLTRYVLAHEADFRLSEVISPGVHGGVIDPEYRRSRVLMDLGKHGDLIVSRARTALPRVLDKLGLQPFSISRTECQITASNHGDFFRHHSDNAEEEIASRELTFVYFFHREPKAFEGGELRLHDAYQENGCWFSTGNYQGIVPEQNQAILFRSSLVHEITPVVCPSQAFPDSRFTVNGWLHK